MVSINTNISSMIVQNNLAKSTNALNQAIERMTTGFKLNHASDNAANYSISNNYSSKLSSYSVAQDNIAAGMDLVATAQDTISLMQSHGERIMALWTQAQNGTYGEESLQAIQSEVNSRIAEINRLYDTTEYNGISLLKGYNLPDWAEEVKANAGVNKGGDGGFIGEIETVTPDVIVTDPAQLASAISSNTKIGIGDAATLRKLAELVNSGTNCSGKTIILTEDIDLNNEEWTAIGTESNQFNGTFDGQGHKVKNLKIDKDGVDIQGLFGLAGSGSTLKNVGVENADIKGGSYTGGLAGAANGQISNSYATGSVEGALGIGGLAGFAYQITNSYATGSVTGSGYFTGGLAGRAAQITNSYATGSVTGQSSTGGLAGYIEGQISNSYAVGNVSGTFGVGGLVGEYYFAFDDVTLNNVFSAGNVTGNEAVGSLIGGLYYNDFGTQDGTLTITNAQTLTQFGINPFGAGIYLDDDYRIDPDYDLTPYLEGITILPSSSTTLQVGINGDNNSQITFNTSLNVGLNVSDIKSAGAYDSINEFLNQLSKRSTELGAVSNRLESALESTAVDIENLTSARSTIKDADIAKVSSDYIRQQILQQASATLLATANQSPALVLQLIQGF